MSTQKPTKTRKRTLEPIAKFVTFYSFKGGVGRSLALINTAAILVGRGFHVLVIDLDLEAPGLSYLATSEPDASTSQAKPNDPKPRPGFVDLLSDAKKQGKNADLFVQSIEELEAGYTQPYAVPDDLLELSDGSLRIMPAGKLDGDYVRRLHNLNLHALYEMGIGEPLIRAFKKKYAEAGRYDFVLVDSRTGFSDEAGVCTRDLADHLMILSGLNDQNIQGTCQFLTSLRLATSDREKFDPKTFRIILSPLPLGYDAIVLDREETAKSAFERAWEKPVAPFLQLPYHPLLALNDVPHIFGQRRGYLFEAYQTLERNMLEMAGYNRLWETVDEAMTKRDYKTVEFALRRASRLDQGMQGLSKFVYLLHFPWVEWGQKDRAGPPESLSPDVMSLKDIFADEQGRDLLQFLVDHVPTNTRKIELFCKQLNRVSPDLAQHLSQRLDTAPRAATDTLDNVSQALYERGHEMDDQELYFKRALEANPDHPHNNRNYAKLLYLQGRTKDAIRYAYRAFELKKEDVDNRRVYGQVLASVGRLPEASEMLLAAWSQSRWDQVSLRAELCFSLWLVSRLLEQEAGYWEAGFKSLIQQVFERGKWNFEPLLHLGKGSLTPEEVEYAQALARAFQNENSVAELDRYDRWRALEPLDPEKINLPSGGGTREPARRS